MSVPEFSRPMRTKPLPDDPVAIEADDRECAALAMRFALPAVQSLMAEVSLETKAGAICAKGRLEARVIQSCAVSGDDFEVVIKEPLDLRFVRESTLRTAATEDGELEVELTADDSDEIEFSGDTFDLGEAVAQSLGLAIDPYAEGPNADAARQSAGLGGDDAPSGPLAEALAALKKD